jgi:hypothetical protein
MTYFKFASLAYWRRYRRLTVETPTELLSILALATGESVRSATQFIHRRITGRSSWKRYQRRPTAVRKRHQGTQEQESLGKRGEKCLRSSSPVVGKTQKPSIRTLVTNMDRRFPTGCLWAHFQGTFYIGVVSMPRLAFTTQCPSQGAGAASREIGLHARSPNCEFRTT